VQLSIYFGQLHKEVFVATTIAKTSKRAGVVIIDVLWADKLIDVLQVKADTALDLALAIQRGLPVAALDNTIKRYKLSISEVEQIVPRKTLMRRRERRDPLTIEESNKLARLVRVFALAEGTLGTLDKAREWMRHTNRALRGQTPISLLNTDQGARLVEQILGRIAHGVFS
jgi:putative toxin-antitoxin system antitoxin component (TIGR02293 family)